jgi:hypothetical protein
MVGSIFRVPLSPTHTEEGMTFMITGGSTMPHKKGDVILVPIPFDDQSTFKDRPAVVVNTEGYSEETELLIVAPLSSTPRAQGMFEKVVAKKHRVASSW